MPTTPDNPEDSDRPYAVLGATGQQGSATVQALLTLGLPVRAILRTPTSPAASALAARGVQVAAADQEDGAALQHALTGVASAFFFTTFDGPDGTAGEVRRGTAVAEAAARAAVPRVVYSSVGGADRGTGVPHFESKRQVELRLSQLLPAKFVRPALFMDNFTAQLAPDADGDVVLRLPMPGTVAVQVVSVRDIGAAAAQLLRDPDAISQDAIELGGDELTLEQAAHATGTAAARPARYEELPLEALGANTDLQAMFSWLASGSAYDADFASSRHLVADLADFPTWLRTQNA